MSVVIETSLGDIVVDLFVQRRPKCSFNFVKLCKCKYFNSVVFHRVQHNFVIQTGDPTGSGRGGESVYNLISDGKERYFDAEKVPVIKHKLRGLVSMINNGGGMHGSQFLITLNENLTSLDDQGHTVFGQVEEGLDILAQFNDILTDKDFRPYKKLRILHTVVLFDPFDSPQELLKHMPDSSPEISCSSDEDEEESDLGSDEEALARKEEQAMAREAKTNAKLLEMVGDLPSEDVKPPDNVLFVCKLNPITNDDDLMVIFSRFGQIKKCEIIRDRKSGESLQYAFVEFADPKDCESAYFKMDNVLIDDRRIHVDFSQSVSKLPQYKKHF